MKRREFTKKGTLGLLYLPLMAGFSTNDLPLKDLINDQKVPIGLDAHSVRGMRWKARQLIDYAIELKMDSILFNSLDYFESLETDYLTSLKKLLDEHEMSLYFGIGSLSINSTSFSSKFGNPKELIEQGLRIAKIFETKSVNCKIGSIADRYTDGGIVARMDEIIGELRSMRSQIQDADIRFAVENHAGDMRSEEVLLIIETVGTDICGAMLDPGNSVWAMEDPMHQLEKLGKYALCTSVRDYNIWESEKGATFQWTALGEGSIDLKHYTNRMSALCPGAPLHIETITNRPNEIPFLEEAFWEGYPDLKAADLLDFYRMIRNGKPMIQSVRPDEKDAELFEKEQQKKELIKSIDFLEATCPAMKNYRQ